MTLPNLTLTMDKRTKSQQTLHLRQSERGLILTVQLCDYTGAPYDLTNLAVRFKDAKAGGKSVSDANVTIATDPKTGIITYPIHSQVFAADGVGWFEVYNTDGALVDSTQNIPIVVDKDISGVIDNSDYISGLSGLKAQLQGIVNSAQQTLDNAVSGANTAASNANQAAQAAQALANDIPNDPKYKGAPGKDGTDGKDGLSITLSDTAITAGDMTTEPDGTLVIDSNYGLYQAVNGKWVLRGNIKGIKGDTGTGIQLKGSADSVDKLPATGNTTGDTYLVAGHLYIWESDAWTDGGELQGPKGDDGRSAYQVWLDDGHTGTEADYLASLKGATGAPGNTGATGPVGPAGKDGLSIWLSPSVISDGDVTDQPDGTLLIDADYDLYLAGYGKWVKKGNIKGATGPAGKDGTTPDLTPYLKSTDAAATYQTQTQVQAQVDAKIVSVADETTASSDSTTNPTTLYLVPEVS